MTDMPNVKGEHLCPICKLGKEYDTTTCKNIMMHAGKWSCEEKWPNLFVGFAIKITEESLQ